MKREISIAVVLLLLILAACRSDIQRSTENNYTPPSIKVQPRLLYPKAAQENYYAGSVKMYLQISKEGVVDKVQVIKSSGHKILDEAAVEYSKGLLFNPAQVNGNLISSRIEWELKFQITDQNWSVHNYVNDLDFLYKKITRVSGTSKIETQKEILNKHNNFIENMTDGLNFNTVLDNVLLTDISMEWKSDWDSWPLSFLLYHDFIKRFPDYDSLNIVKEKLRNAIVQDIKFIQNNEASDYKSQTAKEYLIIKIKKFMSDKYPDIVIDNFGVVINIKDKSLS